MISADAAAHALYLEGKMAQGDQHLPTLPPTPKAYSNQ